LHALPRFEAAPRLAISPAVSGGLRSAFRTGYILSGPADLFWFLSLPFVAVLIALGFQHWLPYVAVASINLWITVPHHYATWVRTYGMPDVWQRFKERLVVGPIAILLLTIAGLLFAPITLLLLVTAWDHQHSVMQQHGLSRVYDFKAKAGMASTPRYDFALHWVLYSHMFLNAPMFRFLWVRELHRMGIPISAAFLKLLAAASWVVLVCYLAFYLAHLVRTVRSGASINPVKYAFIGASYFLWYYVAWGTTSILLYAVAHRIMHGVQYIVMVYAFMGRGVPRAGAASRARRLGGVAASLQSMLAGKKRLPWYLLGGLLYAGFFQMLINRPMDEFGFGVVDFAPYPAITQLNLPALDYAASYQLWSLTLVYLAGVLHYYVDSFIWKVRDPKVQERL
jgi:hypothetical protein